MSPDTSRFAVEGMAGLVDRFRKDAAREVLRKASSTLSCTGSPKQGQCAATDAWDATGGDDAGLGRILFTLENHRAYASVLLDGFSVDEITQAEKYLTRKVRRE